MREVLQGACKDVAIGVGCSTHMRTSLYLDTDTMQL